MSGSPPAAAAILVLPDPCLVVLVGAAGSGKSTLAARLFPAEAVLSSDAHRALVSGDESDQGATRTAFSILHRRLSGRLAQRRTSVVDATNVTSYARRSLVRRAGAHGIAAVAIVLALAPGTVLARNATRGGRIVPVAAVERQLADLERSLRRRSFDAEGFAAVHVLRMPLDVDALSVEWLATGG
jgi:predicted kinase